MAKVETTRLVDDITGGEADETVDFGLDGRLFEIDLTSAHARRLRDGLAPFVSAARLADTSGARRARARASAAPASSGPAAPSATGSDAATREHNRAVRVWARDNGFTVSERGRIPSEVVEAYRRGTPATAAVAAPAPSAPSVPAAPEQPEQPEQSEQDPAPATDRPQAPSVQFSG
ncbi:hypothetical protein JOF36_003962 [Pseudonocardia parietis]|uniref:Lsr2 protein n=1 Tax=Pseudonocardia parietis TaxID=570936 RepID=A0ABS4VWF4_9PSEU|nr:hypothetical protein [Pseudonocardia parietis]